jgi:protein gp37
VGQPYEGLVRLGKQGPRWTGVVRLVPEKLAEPLGWKRPRRVFVNSMSDLFHEGLTNEEIAAVFGVMASASRHTFQVLTKRAERMRDWFRWVEQFRNPLDAFGENDMCQRQALGRGVDAVLHHVKGTVKCYPWPLQNVWLGVSVEDQQRAHERIPHLFTTPAVVRFLSVEPMLGPVDIFPWLGGLMRCDGCGTAQWPELDGPVGRCGQTEEGEDRCRFTERRCNWVIWGGESGPGSRPFDIDWGRSIVDQCHKAGVPCFSKQFGSRPHEDVGLISTRYETQTDLVAQGRLQPDTRRNFQLGDRWKNGLVLRDRKGGDPAEWPGGPEAWPREFPEVP